jgi:phosphoenolpyruvate-protein kinase (PTS system EI component)
MQFRVGLSSEQFPESIAPHFDGVGLIRGEYICRRRFEYVTIPACRNAIQDYLVHCCQAFTGKPVWYRFTELQCNEVNVLDGVDHYVDNENNPVVGMRGIRRARQYPETFRLELECVTAVARKYPNLNVLFPFVRDRDDMVFGRDELMAVGFPNQFGMMAEIPSSILLLEDFMDLGISNVTIGMNDLTCLTLGSARQSEFERFDHPSLIRLIELARACTRKARVELSVAGYVKAGLLPILDAIGIDFAVVHYSNLPEVLGGQWSGLPDRLALNEIKLLTRSKIRDRQREILARVQ